jgi:ATP-binding cassette subfamily C (CFTR/MRP) protein 2
MTETLLLPLMIASACDDVQVKVRGRTAYAGQSAWIQNATVKDNILFGEELDEAKYQETIRVCSLTQDLAQMTFGDKTEIDERGVNLSGGQKQRIQLARAVYQDSDVYILDDFFSAIDAHTGSDLFKVHFTILCCNRRNLDLFMV